MPKPVPAVPAVNQVPVSIQPKVMIEAVMCQCKSLVVSLAVAEYYKHTRLAWAHSAIEFGGFWVHLDFGIK